MYAAGSGGGGQGAVLQRSGPGSGNNASMDLVQVLREVTVGESLTGIQTLSLADASACSAATQRYVAAAATWPSDPQFLGRHGDRRAGAGPRKPLAGLTWRCGSVR